MKIGIQLILLVIALILVFLRAIGVNSARVDLGWLGLAVFIAAFIFA